MKYEPIGEDEGLLADGTYPFEVKTASDQYSKTGNEMIKVMLLVNGETIVFDYLIEAMKFKLKHFCEAVGLDYSGNLEASDCEGKCGRVKIVIKEDGFGKKNEVKDYIPASTDEIMARPKEEKAKAGKAAKASKPKADDEDDSCPF